MKIQLCSLIVDDQEKALKFYTDVLGFVKKHDIPMGEFRWLTVTSPEGHDDVELVLEPNAHPASKVYQKALFDDGVPLTAFHVDDVQREYERLSKHGVVFQMPPTAMGPVTVAKFEDTCGNLIQIVQA